MALVAAAPVPYDTCLNASTPRPTFPGKLGYQVQLSELPALEVCLSVAAPPRKVWALISDITRVRDWGGECVHAEWIDGADGPVAGARFRGRQVRQGHSGPACRW